MTVNMTPRGTISDTLIRISKQRILSYETALSASFHMDDPEKSRLEKALYDERASLHERLSR